MTTKRLLVVEDEPLIAIMVEDLVQELGWEVAGTAGTADDAIYLLDRCSPNLALLDINLGLSNSLSIAATCRDRDIPIVFMTGYTAKDVPAQCGNAPVITALFDGGACHRSAAGSDERGGLIMRHLRVIDLRQEMGMEVIVEGPKPQSYEAG